MTMTIRKYGAISIPLYSPYKFTKQWTLGKTVCKLWLISDYAMSTASVYNIVLISFDRYLSVTKAVSYRSSQNSKLQTAIKMGIVWILSFLLYTPGFFIYEKNQPEYICLAGFNSETKFLLGTSCFDFFLPFLCIAFFNLAIYWNILKRSKKKSHSSAHWAVDEDGDEKKPYTVFTENAVSTPGTVNGKKGLKDCLACCLSQKKAPKIAATNALSTQLARDKKAATSLAVLVTVFTFCWAPYSILASCREYCQVPYLSDVTTWLLWINSAINPALYPLCHKSFKEAFALLGKKVFSICKGKPSV
ncbi:histamine H4 receptor [Gastrophryne carolinensis]